MISSFLKHEPCPSCRENGEDRKGDNLGRYTNGSAFCFKCGYTEKPTIFRGFSKPQPKSLPELTKQLAKKNRDWLGQYLTQEDINKFFVYAPTWKAHVFRHTGPNGEVFWEARSVDPKAVRSGGEKPKVFFGSRPPLVIVEDVVSAIKVSHVCLAMPLFGAYMRPDWISSISMEGGIRKVFYWLDKDKKADSLRYAEKTRMLIPSSVIFTEKDPKCYDTEEIRKILSGTIP
jgi:hypothetical protein